MDAWGLLIEGSSLDTGDAWSHLLNQVGDGSGTGEGGYLILADGVNAAVAEEVLLAEIEDSNIMTSITDPAVEAAVDTRDTVSAGISTTPIGVGISDPVILAEISNDSI